MVSLSRNDYRRRAHDEIDMPAGSGDIRHRIRRVSRQVAKAVPFVPEPAVYDRKPHPRRSTRAGDGLRRRLVRLLLDLVLRIVPKDHDGLLLTAMVRHWPEYRTAKPLNRLEPNVRRES